MSDTQICTAFSVNRQLWYYRSSLWKIYGFRTKRLNVTLSLIARDVVSIIISFTGSRRWPGKYNYFTISHWFHYFDYTIYPRLHKFPKQNKVQSHPITKNRSGCEHFDRSCYLLLRYEISDSGVFSGIAAPAQEAGAVLVLLVVLVVDSPCRYLRTTSYCLFQLTPLLSNTLCYGGNAFEYVTTCLILHIVVHHNWWNLKKYIAALFIVGIAPRILVSHASLDDTTEV